MSAARGAPPAWARALAVPRSLLFAAVFYAGSVVIVLAAALAAPVSERAFRGAVRGWAGFHRWAARWLAGIALDDGGGPPVAGALYALRHESFYEAIDTPRLFDQPVVFAKRELMGLPLWGWLARRYGIVAIDRAGGAKTLRTMLAAARAAAQAGRPLVIFPEGTRVAHGAAPPLQAGFAGLYKALNLPVIPVAVVSGPCYHRWLKLPGTVRYRFGTPIPPGLPRAEIEARVHAAINALNGERD